AKHSQIYPLLANLEKEAYVSYELVCQRDKPDKKVYSLTDKGREALRLWLAEPAADPVMRDELMLKTYCLSLTDPEGAKRLYAARLEFYRKRQQRLEDTIEALRKLGDFPAGGEAPPFDSPRFGPYILLERSMLTNRTNIEW